MTKQTSVNTVEKCTNGCDHSNNKGGQRGQRGQTGRNPEDKIGA